VDKLWGLRRRKGRSKINKAWPINAQSLQSPNPPGKGEKKKRWEKWEAMSNNQVQKGEVGGSNNADSRDRGSEISPQKN